MPSKQKLNVKISTEGELVGADDALGKFIWKKNFIEGQGYTVEHKTMYQDNISTILLKTNGWGSSGKRTKHIKARYYMSKDTVDRGDLKNIMVPGRGNRGRCVNRTKTRQRIPSIQKQANKCAG